jgi:hypothetical protein
MELSNSKPFEKPKGGLYVGKIIDVVDLPNVTKTYAGVTTTKNYVRIVWVLGSAFPGVKVLDSEGKPFRVIKQVNASMNEKSELFKTLTMILNQAPPLLSSTDQLAELLIGRANQLFLVEAPNPQKAGDVFVNVNGIAQIQPGNEIPATPEGFVRSKDKVKTQAGPQGTPVQTYSQPPQQQQAPAQPQQMPPQFSNVPTSGQKVGF